MVEIESSRLTLDLIPGPDAGWEEIFEFALTFDGYKHYRLIQNLAQIARENRRNTIDKLWASLFYVQKVWHGQDEIPEGEYLDKFKLLVKAIHEKVADTEIEGSTDSTKMDRINRTNT
jgi:hypothetical protein